MVWFQRQPKLQEQDQNKWWETMGDLQRMLRKAAQVLVMARKINKEQMHNYFMSGKNRAFTFRLSDNNSVNRYLNQDVAPVISW